jgi:hypothetical protein
MKRTLGFLGVVAAVLLASPAGASSREDRAQAESLVAAYTEAWNRQDRGPFSIVLREDGAFDDVLGRFPHDVRRPAEGGANRLETRVTGFRTLSPERFQLEVEWRLDGKSGRFLHTVERTASRYAIAATAERPSGPAASAQ